MTVQDYGKNEPVQLRHPLVQRIVEAYDAHDEKTTPLDKSQR